MPSELGRPNPSRHTVTASCAMVVTLSKPARDLAGQKLRGCWRFLGQDPLYYLVCQETY